MAKPVPTFLSFRYQDVMQVRALRLLNANPNHPMRFTERSFIEPAKGTKGEKTWEKIHRTQDKTAVTLVAVGRTTHESKSVEREVEYARKHGMGVAAMYLPGKEGSKVPDFLKRYHVMPVPWDANKVNSEIARAKQESTRAGQARVAKVGTGGCGG